MKRIACILALLILTACGSGDTSGGSDDSNNPFFLSESIGLSCVEASNVDDDICEESPREALGMRSALDNGPVHDSIYNAGDISKSEFVYYDLKATNGAYEPAWLYILIDEGGAHGCESRNITTSTGMFYMNQRAHKIMGTSGTMYDICATNGPSWANVTIFNAEDVDLYTTTILWNFID